MNDPHVSAIHYCFEFGENIEYSPPDTTLSFSMGSFDVSVQDRAITLSPRVHFATRESARCEADPLIRAWEMEAGIRARLPTLRITYQRTEVIDREPTPVTISVSVEALGSTAACASAVLVRHLSEYPAPLHPDFSITPDVETLWRRYLGFFERREPLLAMAYFCYTVLTPGKGGRALAANRLNVEEDVLSKLGELSSTRGDQFTARKATYTILPLTSQESHWLDVAVRMLIIQLAMSSGRPPAHHLRMSDLPPL